MTKSIITFAVAVLLCFSVAAQDFISPVKQWNVRLAALGYSTEVFKIAGDSLVEGTSYNKIWVSYDSLTTWVFQGLLREASDVVYYMPPGHSEGVLYDFNLGVGATAMVRNIFCGDEDIPITVIHMDTVAYNGIERKRWHLGANGNVAEYWVEGIGSLNGPLYTSYWHCIVCPVWDLLCYFENDTLAFKMPYTTECYQNTVGLTENVDAAKAPIVIYPNPVKRGNPLSIESAAGLSGIRIYDARGLLLQNAAPGNSLKTNICTAGLAPGLYIVETIHTAEGISRKRLVVE
jgi:hypothetical protein